MCLAATSKELCGPHKRELASSDHYSLKADDKIVEMTTEQDTFAIQQLINEWNTGWDTQDPALAARANSEDAEWVNAFGMLCTGRAEIEAMLREVFALPFVMAAKSRVVDQTIRFLTPTVAVICPKVERVGQQTPTGVELPVRHTSHLRDVQKFAEEWKSVSHLISYARDRQRAQH